MLTVMLGLAAAGRAHAAATLYRLSYLNYCHLLTASQSDRDNLLASGWALEGTAGDVCGSSTDESMLVPLYRLYNASNYDHFYTVNQDTRSSMLAAGWIDQGITGYVYQSDDTGRQPLFCAYSQVNGQHQFTADRTQYNNLDSTWTREGIAAYVKTTAAPLFRENDPTGLSYNLITISKAENDSLVGNGWNTSGVIAYAYAIGTEEPGLVPLYRLYNPAWADHVFTTSQSEHDAWVSLGWQDQGTACYVFTEAGADHEPLYRAFNTSTHQHLFTTDPAEYNALSSSWNKEGIDAYVMYNPVPAGLTVVTTGSGKMGLYWQSIPNATGYNVYRSTTPGGENYSTPVNATPVNTPSYPGSPWCTLTDTGLTDGTQYYYTVEAVYSTGSSDPSAEDSDVVSASGIPWDSTNPATVLTAVRAYWQNIPEYPSFASAPFSVGGPDGQVYEDGQSTVLPPDTLDIPGADQVQLADGSQVTMPHSSEATVTIQNAQPQALEVEKGPYRRVETSAAGYWADRGRFDVPVSGNVFRSSAKEGVYLFIGSSSAVGVPHPIDVDAGLAWSQPNQGWAPFMNVTRPTPTAKDPNKRTTYGLGLPRPPFILAPGQYADLIFEAHNGSVGKGLSLLVITLPGPTPKPYVFTNFSGYASQEQVRVKRVIAVGQPCFGVVKTGTYITNAAWELGAVLTPIPGADFDDWYAANYPSESGSYPLDSSIVSWNSVTDYLFETNISINLRP